MNKLRAYALQDGGLDTLDANHALGGGSTSATLVAATMLEALGLRRVRLLIFTSNPHKLAVLAACGIDVAGRVPLAFAPNGIDDRYHLRPECRFVDGAQDRHRERSTWTPLLYLTRLLRVCRPLPGRD